MAFLKLHNVSAALEVQMPAMGTKEWTTFVDSHVNIGSRPRCCVKHQRLWHLLQAISRVPLALRATLPRAEFGVRDAVTIRALANSSNEERTAQWHGFDSFQGLPQSESAKPRRGVAQYTWKAGAFTRGGRLPTVPRNVQLHPGWFNQSLASFMTAQEAAAGGAAYPHGFAFVHMDADIYESTLSVLNLIFAQCWYRRGSVFAFDELFGPASQAEHEFRALTEASTRHGVQWHFLSYHLTPSSTFARAAVQIDSGCAWERHGSIHGPQDMPQDHTRSGTPLLAAQTEEGRTN